MLIEKKQSLFNFKASLNKMMKFKRNKKNKLNYKLKVR